jgi:C-terminal peptidase prc
VPCRPLGILIMEDEAGVDGKVLAVPTDKVLPIYTHWKTVQDVNQMRLKAITHFFEHYKDLEAGKWVKVLGWEGIDAAKKEVLDGIAYISLAQFGESTGTEVREMLDQFREENAKRLIIDLRDDGGGYLDALKDVLNCFLPADTVFILREYSDGTKEESRTSGGKYQFVDGIVLLVNESTASASEAFTMAMKEKRDDVTIVGTKTYGKGSVQSLIRLSKFGYTGAIRLTTLHYFPPCNEGYDGIGIYPDEKYSVSLSEEAKKYALYELPQELDDQLRAAINSFN